MNDEEKTVTKGQVSATGETPDTLPDQLRYLLAEELDGGYLPAGVQQTRAGITTQRVPVEHPSGQSR